MISDRQIHAIGDSGIRAEEHTRHMGERSRVLLYAAMFVVMASAIALRLDGLGSVPLWVDEAESGINALTILQHGYPTDTYLGLPVFENTLVKPWPGNEEYEFRDLSYSSNGVALYHGWFPLYAICAAFKLSGVKPEYSPATVPRYGPSERRFRTIVARTPSVYFGMLAVLGLYLSAARLHGRAAGLTAALLSALGPLHISFSQQARYYSATVALSAFCCWSATCMVQRRRWKDFCLGGLLFSILFHTHMLTFAVMGAIFLACFITTSRGPSFWRDLSKPLVFCGMVAAMTVPWVVATGFLGQNAAIPKVWTLVTSIGDLVVAPIVKSEYGFLLCVGFVLMLCGVLGPRSRWTRAVASVCHPHRFSFIALYVWLITAYLTFVLLIPVASFALARLVLVLLVPATLITAVIITSCARLISKKHSAVLTSVMAGIFLAVSGLLHPPSFAQSGPIANNHLDAAIKYLSHARVTATTKLYASPNEHLVLTFYTGMPVQSIAPVRKTFLDQYEGRVIFFERMDFTPTGAIQPTALSQFASWPGEPLDRSAAEQLSCDLASLSYRRQLISKVKYVTPEVRPVPVFAAAAFAAHEQQVLQNQRRFEASTVVWLPIFWNLRVFTPYDWWTGFFYRFVDPKSRREHPNFEDRFRNATAIAPPCQNWLIIDSPGLQSRY